MALLALGVLVSYMIGTNSQKMYPGTILVRSCVILPVMAWLYFKSNDPLFITLLIVVGLGLVLTSIGYIADRKQSQKQ
jgi:hypothetical protein